VTDAIDLAAGEGHACAVRADGDVVCWGRNDHGQAGAAIAAAIAPTVVAGVDHAVAVVAGPAHTCAQLADGTVRCWGQNDQYQLGDGGDPIARPRALVGATEVVEVVTGRAHTCVRSRAGVVACLGGSDRGAFGFPPGCAAPQHRGIGGTSGVIMSYCASLTPVPEVAGAVQLAHGEDHACARLADGTVRCWGGAGHSELGNRAHGALSSAAPIGVDLQAPVVAAAVDAPVLAVAAAGSTSCALMTDRTVRCWGDGNLGQLGVPGESLRTAGAQDFERRRAHPEAVPGVADARAIGLGSYTGCAVLGDGHVTCWGYNGNGERGDRTPDRSPAAAPVPGLAKAIAVAVSPSSMAAHACAIVSGGAVWCWGANTHGQLGVAAAPADGAPIAVPGVTDAVQLATGDATTCAVRKDGSVWCWGANDRGQLGGAAAAILRPAAISGVAGAAAVAIAYDHACARLTDGTVRCWGAGQARAAPVAALTDVVAIAAGYSGMLAVRHDGAVVGWYFDANARLAPVDGLTDATQVSSSGYHHCALRRDQTVRCWGANGAGQMGDAARGVGGDQTVPSPVRW